VEFQVAAVAVVAEALTVLLLALAGLVAKQSI
jgi:hypothetical protein